MRVSKGDGGENWNSGLVAEMELPLPTMAVALKAEKAVGALPSKGN